MISPQYRAYRSTYHCLTQHAVPFISTVLAGGYGTTVGDLIDICQLVYIPHHYGLEVTQRLKLHVYAQECPQHNVGGFYLTYVYSVMVVPLLKHIFYF